MSQLPRYITYLLNIKIIKKTERERERGKEKKEIL